MKKDILGIKIDDVSLDQVVSTVEQWLGKGDPASPATIVDAGTKRGEKSFGKAQDKHYIVTPNPEIVMMAQKDRELKDILNRADLAIPDGVGLKLAGDIVMTTPGIDVMEGLVKMAEDRGFTTGFLGGRGEVAAKTAECLKEKYPKLEVTFAGSGGEVDDQGESLGVLSARSPIRSPRFASLTAGTQWGPPLAATPRDMPSVDLLFVAFGPPKQEKWIAKNLDKIPVKVAMGVGGAFDYLSGKVPRAPKWIRNLGFEWLFRLLVQPWRITRQLALLKYLWLLTKRL